MKKVKMMWCKVMAYLTKSSATSFGSCRKLPLWRSVLADYAYILSFGLYRP